MAHRRCYNVSVISEYEGNSEMDIEFLNKLLNVIESAEKDAAELILHAGSILAESKTGHRDVVTEYDRRVQELVVKRLSEFLPDASFVMEESDSQDAVNAEHLFIIDPIDGTMNFVRHYRHSAISVAYASFGEILIGCVYDPFADEMFSAIKGQGAFLNGEPIHADTEPLSETLFCFGTSPYYPELTDETFRLARIVFENCLDLRRLASAALDLCAVAAGRAGLYFELRLSPWDYAAGILIVEEAGGRVCTIDGDRVPLSLDKPSVVAGGVQALRDFMGLIGKAGG